MRKIIVRKSYDSPTKKQLMYIRYIQEETGIKYTGKTKAEATKYIKDHHEEATEIDSLTSSCSWFDLF